MKFRKIYVVEPPKDYSALTQYTQNIEFIASGLEDYKDLNARIYQALKTFDPTQDAIVAYGRTNTILLVGMMLRSLFPYATIQVGIYKVRSVKTKQYEWMPVDEPLTF